MQVAQAYRTIILPCAIVYVLALTGCGGSAGVQPAAVNQPVTQPPPVEAPSTVPQNATTIPDIQKRDGWFNCSAKTKSGTPCASGEGEADAWLAQSQATPSLSGSSAEFHIGGGTGYSNNLWWNQLQPDRSPSHFIYDFWVYLKDPERSQAMEFDVNQSFDGTRWVFGTECNFNGNGLWDVWDGSGDVGHWVPSKVGCSRFAPNSWNHIVWKFERNGTQVHYISVSINDVEYPVDIWLSAQSNWSWEELNVAVQLDGNFQQQPYEAWIDNMKLVYW